MFWVKSIFTLIFFISSAARTELAESSASRLQKTVYLINTSKNMSDLAEKMHPYLSRSDYQAMIEYATLSKGETLPRVVIAAPDIIEIISTNSRSTVQLLEGFKVKVDGKTIDLSKASNLRERLQTLEKELHIKTSLYNLFIPQAHAVLPAYPIYMIVVLAISSVAGVAMGFLNQHDEMCKEVGEALVRCLIHSSEVSQFGARQHQAIKDFEAKKKTVGKVKVVRDPKKSKAKGKAKSDEDEADVPELEDEAQAWKNLAVQLRRRGECPAVSVDAELDKNAAESLGAIYNVQRLYPNLFTGKIGCGDEGPNSRMNLARKCAENLRVKSQTMCLRRAMAVGDMDPMAGPLVSPADSLPAERVKKTGR